MPIQLAEVVQVVLDQVKRAETAEHEVKRLRTENQELKKKIESLTKEGSENHDEEGKTEVPAIHPPFHPPRPPACGSVDGGSPPAGKKSDGAEVDR